MTVRSEVAGTRAMRETSGKEENQSSSSGNQGEGQSRCGSLKQLFCRPGHTAYSYATNAVRLIQNAAPFAWYSRTHRSILSSQTLRDSSPSAVSKIRLLAHAGSTSLSDLGLLGLLLADTLGEDLGVLALDA